WQVARDRFSDRILTGSEQVIVSGHSDSVSSVAFAPDGMRLASGSVDATARIWLNARFAQTDYVRDLAFSPDDSVLVSAGSDGTIRFWDRVTGQPSILATPPLLSGQVSQIAFSPASSNGGAPNDLVLAAASANKSALLWNVRTATPVGSLAHGHEIDDVAF